MKRKDLCAGCGDKGPEATSTSTMAMSGWRMHSWTDEDGLHQSGWFCPACWEKKTGTAPIQRTKSKP